MRSELREALAEAKAAGRPACRVAADAHIDPTILARIVRGRHVPHRVTREAIARVLGRDADDLFPDLERADVGDAGGR